ncbi:NAD-binding protein [Actinomycetes bacterium KLBMP 9797]
MDHTEQERNQTPVMVLRLGFVGLAVIALVLGYVGFAEHLAGQDALSRRPEDILYHALQLFVLDAEPPLAESRLPWQLQVARFAAPAATVFALVETARVLLTSELQRLSARNARHHVVVCGDSVMARTLAARLHAAGRRVIVVGTPPAAGQALPRRRLYGVPGDPTNAEVLRAAGAGRADVIYACTDDSADNVLAATTASRLRRDRNATMRVYAQIHDPDLCLSLQARRLSLAEHAAPRLDFFNADELAARSLFLDAPLPAGRPVHVLIVGGSPFGRAVLVEAARHWRLRTAERLRVDLVADDAHTVRRDLVHRYPFLADVCDIRVPDRAPPDDRPPDRTFVCYDDEEHSLKAALTTPALWQGGAGSVWVPVSRLSGLARAFHNGAGLLDAVSGTVRLYPVVQRASDPDQIGDDLVERLARAIHDRYLLAHGRHPVSPPWPGGHAVPVGRRYDALVPWAELAEELRHTNRAQAEDIGRKLRTIGLALVPRASANPSVGLTDEQVEELAALEHARWRAERERVGWRLADRRDGASRTHPDLRAWAELPERTREKNRAEVRNIPHLLGDVGLEMVPAAAGASHGPGREQGAVV